MENVREHVEHLGGQRISWSVMDGLTSPKKIVITMERAGHDVVRLIAGPEDADALREALSEALEAVREETWEEWR